MAIDFSRFRNPHIISLLEQAARLSYELGNSEIGPMTMLVVLNQNYSSEIDRFLQTAGISPQSLYSSVASRITETSGAYTSNAGGVRMSDELIEAFELALQLESMLPATYFPNAPLMTALLKTPGRLNALASSIGLTSSGLQRALTYSQQASTGQTTPRNDRRSTQNTTEAISPIPVGPEGMSIIGIEKELKELREFCEGISRLSSQRRLRHIGYDCIISGATGTGKSYLANIITCELYKIGEIVNSPEPEIIDAVEWHNFSNNFEDEMSRLSGKVLVIDNAHKLLSRDSSNNIGSLDRLFTEMNKAEGRPVIILIGDQSVLGPFFANNSAVRHKFQFYFNRQGYSLKEYRDICRFWLKGKYRQELSPDVVKRLEGVIRHMMRQRDNNWANAHTVVELADIIYMAMKRKGRNSIRPEDIPGTEEGELTLEEILSKLDGFVGIDEIRNEVTSMIYEIQCDRERFGSEASTSSHFVFVGNPGTGKTTIARVFADILKAMDVLPSGHIIEADRSTLVGQYVGETAIKTNGVIDRAMGGVLFIDEAYTLVNDIGSSISYGKEAVDTLLKRLEDDRGKFVCIVAGYPKEMSDFLASNPGMASRFNRTITFRDYTGEELFLIFKNLVEKNRFRIASGDEESIKNYFKSLHLSRSANFGNAREARKVFEEAKKNQGKRLIRMQSEGTYTEAQALILTAKDILGENYAEPVSIDEIMQNMDREFVGMQSVKTALRNFGVKTSLLQKRIEAGLADPSVMGIHILLTGNPGTGKTSVARTLGKILYALQILPTDKVVEAEKRDLVGQSLGSTPDKVNKIVDRAMGGILFVDEAYTLTGGNDNADSFGKEAAETLMKRMEDDRGKFVCILAGYRSEMEEFINVNRGLKSRITHKLHIEDYTREELAEIFKRMVKKEKFSLDPDADRRLLRAIDEMVAAKTNDFGNAREMRTLLDSTIEHQSLRLRQIPNPSREQLSTLKAEDIPLQSPQEINADTCKRKLDELIGLRSVKREIAGLASYLTLEKMRAQAFGKSFNPPGDHYLFLGNPGTGKTTVARILGEIFLNLGISKNTKFVESDRSSLVAGYVGQTAIKTNRLIDSALGGILFIDEAYTLNQGPNDSFGQEAIDTLLKRMEDDRGKFVCIAAGYVREMEQFIRSNSGLQSRFNKTLIFEDYTQAELEDILKLKIKKEHFQIDPSAYPALSKAVAEIYRQRSQNFGNAREINNLFQKIKERQGTRIMSGGIHPTERDLVTLLPSDFSSSPIY